MKSTLVLLFIITATNSACWQTEKSKELINQAIDIFLFSSLDETIKIDSSLSLTKKALELDDENISVLTHMVTLLFLKRDGEGLIKVADKLIQLKPNVPTHIEQKAVYLELMGEYEEAMIYFDKAEKIYEELLNDDPLNFGIMLGYVGCLEYSGNVPKANSLLEKMKKMNFEDYQLEILEHYKEQFVSKEQLMKYWSGEIDINQLTKDM